MWNSATDNRYIECHKITNKLRDIQPDKEIKREIQIKGVWLTKVGL